MKASTTNIAISVVIPHYNNVDKALRCLKALHRQTLARSEFEIILVDNGSGESIEILKALSDQVIVYRKHKNPYICRNMGARAARADKIAFLDSTCLPDKSWLEAGLQALKKHDTVAGKFVKKVDPDDLYSLYYGYSHLNNGLSISNNAPVVGGNLFFCKEALEQIGYFPTSSRSGGDIKLSQKSIAAGQSRSYCPEARVKIEAKNKTQLLAAEKRFGRGAYQQNKDKPWWWHAKMILYHLLPDKPSRIRRKIDYQENPELYYARFWRLWWVTWHINLVYLWGYLSGLFLPTRELYLD